MSAKKQLQKLDAEIAKITERHTDLSRQLAVLRRQRVQTHGLPSVKIKKYSRKTYSWVRVYFTDDEFAKLKAISKELETPMTQLLVESFRDKYGDK